MDHNETGCEAPERPILCFNNCGFFGSATTMNMCSKCYKEAALKDDREKLAASSIENFVNGTSSKSKDSIVTGNVEVRTEVVEETTVNPQVSCESRIGDVKKGPSRCTTCRKRVGLTGFSCRCGNMFCPDHRYSDRHECPFDYRGNAQSSIAKANPVIKAAKLDKI